jgi:hypothetical protein
VGRISVNAALIEWRLAFAPRLFQAFFAFPRFAMLFPAQILADSIAFFRHVPLPRQVCIVQANAEGGRAFHFALARRLIRA